MLPKLQLYVFSCLQASEITADNEARFPIVKPRNITLGPAAPAFESPFPDITFLSIQFRFETNLGKAFGLTRLVWDVDTWRSFTCFTLLEEIHEHQRNIGENRPRGSHNDKVSYDEKRQDEIDYVNRSPDVLISESACKVVAA